MRTVFIPLGCAAVVLLPHLVTTGAEPATGPLTVHPTNPLYFADATGKAVYLTGSHVWDNLQDYGPTNPPSARDFDAHLDFLEAIGHNHTRGWAWEQSMYFAKRINDPYYITPLPFKRTGPGAAVDGLPKFDLTQFNDAYFERLEERALAAGSRGIYMSIMLFQGFSVDDRDQHRDNPWDGHPFNSANNINGIDGDANNDGQGTETHTLNIPAVTAVQEAYVRRAIDELNHIDTIFWEISNESRGASVSWQYHMINLIKDYETNTPGYQRHLVCISGAGADAPSNEEMLNSPADIVSFGRLGLSQSNPPAATGNKIGILDTDHHVGIGGDRSWIWKDFTRGYHPIFMDPLVEAPGGSPADPDNPTFVSLRRAMGHTLSYANRMDLASTTPQNAHASTGYCLADVGRTYLVYLPVSASTVSVNLTAGLYYYEWFNPVSGTVASTGSAATQGGVELFTVPFAGDAVLFLYNANTLSEVWIDLGTIDMQNRLDHLQPSDGETVPDSINIRSCRRNLDLEGPDPDSRFYFSVDDEFAFEGSEPEVHITIEYFDLGTGVLTLRYDSSYQAPFPNDVYKNGGSVVLADSGAWKTHTFHVTDAYFGNRQSEGADLLIARDPNGIFYLDVVKISTKPGPAVLTQPLPVTVHQNQSYQLTVAATPSGAASLSYRWQRNGQDLDDDLRISGANTATLNVSQARMEDAGNYRCAVVEDVMRTYTNEVSVELAPLGDFDRDSDVDQADFGHLQHCFHLPLEPISPGCSDADLDLDLLIDETDLMDFIPCISGPNEPSGC